MAPGGDRDGDVDELLDLIAKRALVPRLADAEVEDPPPLRALVPDDLQHEQLAGARARDLRIGVVGGEHAAAAGRVHRRAEGRKDALAHRQRMQLDRRPRLAETGKTRPVQEGLGRRIGEWSGMPVARKRSRFWVRNAERIGVISADVAATRWTTGPSSRSFLSF